MKKFLFSSLAFLLVLFVAAYLYYGIGIFIPSRGKVSTSFITTEDEICIINDGNSNPFEIKGVNLSSGIPGHFSTDYAIDKKTYLRWFAEIKAMGANTIRVYTVLNSDFYQAVYEYNTENPDPLYILHGVWVNDYIQFSYRDAYSDDFMGSFTDNSKTLVDVIHGNKLLTLESDGCSGSFIYDISPWVIGYILGVEWEGTTVAYTDHMQVGRSNYQGKYMYTTEQASPFEAMLARVGDEIISYETSKYAQQRLVAFSNSPFTDPFDYPENMAGYFNKIAKIDVEHIKTSDRFISGTFASYHVYSNYPDFLGSYEDKSAFADNNGVVDTYFAYLKMLTNHHSIPVVISEFGYSTARGVGTGKADGSRISENNQGDALVDCYYDIRDAGCAGAIVFSWQDEWHRRSWNTMHAVDLLNTPEWSDYQSAEQYFGLLSFDPGEKSSICYVDGDISEWNDIKPILQGENYSLKTCYDEKYIYILASVESFEKSHSLYIPIDITPRSGTLSCNNYNINFERPSDFVLSIKGTQNSRLLVQERYEVLRAMFNRETNGEDAYENPPEVDTPLFKPIYMILESAHPLGDSNVGIPEIKLSDIYETGVLTYGNANPEAEDYNSLSDFCFSDNYVEIRLPWQILNFSDPSKMKIHDDYYLNYGVEQIGIDQMYLGVGSGGETIPMASLSLKGWNNNVSYHERLKPAYYSIQIVWSEG